MLVDKFIYARVGEPCHREVNTVAVCTIEHEWNEILNKLPVERLGSTIESSENV